MTAVSIKVVDDTTDFENPQVRTLRTSDLASGGGGGGGEPSNALTNAQLRASPVPMKPVMGGSGNAVISQTGNTATALGSQACVQVTVYNVDAEDIVWVWQGGQAVPVFPMSSGSFFGISNTNQLSLSWGKTETAKQIPYRWES